MKILVILLLGLAAAHADKIVGGEDAGQAIPYQARIQYSTGSIRCGASLISDQWILTAARCQGTEVQWHTWTIALGVYDSTAKESAARYFGVAEHIPHVQYDSNTVDNDVMLIKLDKVVTYSNSIGVVTLPELSTMTNVPASGTPCLVSGWGTLTEGGSTSTTLQKVTVNVVDQTECQRSYAGLTGNMLCLGVDDGGKDACQGDSGGPAVCDGVLNGILSWRVGCARRLFPGVYTRVAVYRDWISDNTNNAV